MSLSTRARRYVKVRGWHAAPLQVAKYIWRACVHRQDPVEARRRALGVQLHKRFGGIVQTGPLKGFRMGDDLTWGAGDRGSMLVGFYETQVTKLLAKFRENANVLIDVGAADGYFGVGTVAAGLYLRSVCFERDEITRDVLSNSAELNRVSDKITIFGAAGLSFLSDLRKAKVDLDKAVILCDIEGGEFDLFDGELLESLSQCRMVIEMHDKMFADGEARRLKLVASAEKHFSVSFLDGGGRNPGAEPALCDMPDDDKWLICSEGRMVQQQWMVLEPKQSVSSSR